MYQELADEACNRITAAITKAEQGNKRPIKAVRDPYNATGTTRFVNFNTSKTERWETNGPPTKCHVNWVILDSDWEAEFCRVAERHPRVVAYVKNHNLGLEVPYRFGSEIRCDREPALVDVEMHRAAVRTLDGLCGEIDRQSRVRAAPRIVTVTASAPTVVSVNDGCTATQSRARPPSWRWRR